MATATNPQVSIPETLPVASAGHSGARSPRPGPDFWVEGCRCSSPSTADQRLPGTTRFGGEPRAAVEGKGMTWAGGGARAEPGVPPPTSPDACEQCALHTPQGSRVPVCLAAAQLTCLPPPPSHCQGPELGNSLSCPGLLPITPQKPLACGRGLRPREHPERAGPTWRHTRSRLGLRSCRYTCRSLSAVAQELASSSVHSRSRRVRTSRSSVCRWGQAARGQPSPPCWARPLWGTPIMHRSYLGCGR